jgi:hypothetical protein
MYSDDSMLAAQKKMMATQKRALAKKKRDEARPVPQATPAQNISVFESLDRLDNDIQLSKKDLDEYLDRHGNASNPIPNLHQVGPLSRKILSELKKINFRDVPENELRELHAMGRKLYNSWNELRPSFNELNRKGVGYVPRTKDDPYRRLYELARKDLNELAMYIMNNLSNVRGHNFLSGSGIPKRFL